MRVAFTGKGGSGKSTIAGTIARLLGREGAPVLALDLDTVPGLSFSIGFGDGVPGDAGLPADLAERREGEGWVMKEAVDAGELVDRYSVAGPDDVRLLQLGKLPERVRPGSTTAFRHVLQTFDRPGWSVVGDLAAGTRQASFGWASFARSVAIVAEPSQAGLLSAERLARMGEAMEGARLGLVLNKLDDDLDVAPIERRLGLPVWERIPRDERVRRAERDGRAPIDEAPESELLASVRRLLDQLRRQEEREEREERS